MWENVCKPSQQSEVGRKMTRRARTPWTLIAFGLFVVAVWASCGARAAQATIDVDQAVLHQTIDTWEATAQIGQDNPDNRELIPRYRQALLEAAIRDLGINRLRLALKSGSENTRDLWNELRAGAIDDAQWRCMRYSTVNDNNDPFSINWAGFHFSELDDWIETVILPARAIAAANGDTLQVNLNYTAFTGQICNGLPYNHNNAEEYAEFIQAAFLHMQDKYGFVPDFVEVILEPDNTAYWRGKQIGEAIVATAARLESNGFSPRFIAPSNTNMARAITYFDDMMKVPGVSDRLAEFSYHRYGGVNTTNLTAIGSRAQQYNVRTAMLEKIGAGARELHDDLEVGRNSSWQRFIIGGPATSSDDSGVYFQVDVANPDEPAIKWAGQTAYFRQYFRYIRNGAQRVGATSSANRIDPLAFVNTDGSIVVVFRAGDAGPVVIKGLPAGTYGLTWSANGRETQSGPDIGISQGQPLNVAVPDDGVYTVFARLPPAPEAAPSKRPGIPR